MRPGSMDHAALDRPLPLVFGFLLFLLAGGVPRAEEPELPVWREGERARWEAGGSPAAAKQRPTPAEPLDVDQPRTGEIAATGTSAGSVPEKYWPAYFEDSPRDYLIDPQGLLNPVDFKDRLGFLKYHAGDCLISLFVYVFKGDQEIPGAVREEELVERFFPDGRLAVMAYYYLGAPQRSVMYLSPSLIGSVSAAERLRALENSVTQAVGETDPSAQLEAFLIRLSSRIYRMEHMLGSVAVAGGETAAAKGPGKTTVILTKLQPVLAGVRRFTLPLAVLAGALVLAIGMNFWLRKRARYRFPELDVEPRLGGVHAAGVGAVISFASAAVSPASQRDQGPDYLRRA